MLEDLTEKKLLSEILNGSDFLEKKDLSNLLNRISSTADSICLDLLTVLKREYPSDVQYLALGKWGGSELGFRSDLDFLLVISDEPKDNDHKLARRLISRLTESHRGGNIYAIDMRLRPSGKAGPLVIPESQLQEYLRNEASPWERQAYLKARFIGKQDLSLQKICVDRSVTSEDLLELERIRLELLKNKSSLDLKYAEGGLIDIEFASQIYLLFHRILPKGPSTFDFLAEMGAEARPLSQNYVRLRQLEQMLQLVASESITNLSPNHESFQFLAKALQTEPEVLIAEVQSLLADNVRILQRLDPRPRPH
ncbi:Glutamate-ammonia-ligase adenylyltransferase [compost metagenome]